MPDQEDAQKSEDRSSGGDANADAKEMLNKGVDTFKKLDIEGKIYLVSLAVVAICVLFFKAYSYDAVIFKGGFTAFHLGYGKLAFLGAGAGIGIYIWSKMASRKDAWVPLALIGCAGLAALMLLVLLFDSGGRIDGESAGLTLLGFWLPFLAAIAATVVSAKKVMKA